MYFAGLDPQTGAVSWSPDVHEAAQLMGGSLTAGELSVRYVPQQNSWLMVLGGPPAPPLNILTVAARSSAYPWGPWTAPHVVFDPVALTPSGQQFVGYGEFIHGCDPTSSWPLPPACQNDDGLSDPGADAIAGLAYAPYLVPSSLFAPVDASRTRVDFAMSTFDPYEADLMETQVGIDSDGDSIPDFTDNCPNVPNSDQQDTDFIAEQAIDVQTNCHGTGCLLPTTPYPTSLGIAEEGCHPHSDDPSGYEAYWHAYYPGDACDTNASAGLTQSPFRYAGTTVPGIASLRFYGYIGNDAGNAAQAQSTSGASFCECPYADSLDATQRVLCETTSTFNCVLGKDSAYPRLAVPSSSKWQTISGVPEVQLAHLDRTDTTIRNGTYVPPMVEENWDWTFDLTRFGLPFSATSMTGALWAHVRDDDGSFEPGPGEGQPAKDTPNAYLATTVSRPPLPSFGLPGSCSEAPVLIPLQNAPDPAVPPWGCFLQAQGLLNLLGQTPIGTIVNVELSPGAQSLLDPIASGAAQLVVGDDVASGLPFGFTGVPALVVPTGNTNILGGVQLEGGGLIEPVGGPASFTTGPDPRILRSYAALDGNLWGLTTVNGAATLSRSTVRRALIGEPVAVAQSVVGAVPADLQAMVWSRADGNLWALDVATEERGDGALRLVRIDILGGAAETWRLRGAERMPDEFFLSASGQGEIVLGLSLDQHSEVALLDARGRALWSAENKGALLSAPVATTAGVGMPMARSPTGQETNVDVRFIRRRDLAPGLCGAPWLRAHANVSNARALQDGDHDQDDCRGRERP